MLCKWPPSRCSSCTDGAAFSMSATTPALKCSCGANINMLVNLKVINEICHKVLSSKAQEPSIANRGETTIHETFYVFSKIICFECFVVIDQLYFYKDIFMLHHLVGMFFRYRAHMLKIQPDAWWPWVSRWGGKQTSRKTGSGRSPQGTYSFWK